MSLQRLFRILAFSSSVLAQQDAGAPPAEHRYVVCVGTESAKLSSATLWLYSFSWYGLEKLKVSAIENGVASVPVDADRLRRQLDPHPNTDGYIWVVQLGEQQWHRTPDIAPEQFWKDLPAGISLLGTTSMLRTGETQLVLPPLSKRRLTLLYPDGRPKAHTDVNLSVYLWNRNHCAAHFGLPLGQFRTDANGVIEVLSHRLPLFLDGTSYYEEAGTGPFGVAYSFNPGLKTGPDESVVLKKLWEVPKETIVRLRILTRSGRPRPDVDVYGFWNTNTCGGHDRVARTDTSGTAEVLVNATFTGLTLMIGGPYSDDPRIKEDRLDLSDGELRELFAKRRLTIRW